MGSCAVRSTSSDCGGTSGLIDAYIEKYFELLGERKVKGYLGMEKNYYSKAGEKGSQ